MCTANVLIEVATEDFHTVGGENRQKKMSSFWAKMTEI
jgi:hypothetical protein